MLMDKEQLKKYLMEQTIVLENTNVVLGALVNSDEVAEYDGKVLNVKFQRIIEKMEDKARILAKAKYIKFDKNMKRLEVGVNYDSTVEDYYHRIDWATTIYNTNKADEKRFSYDDFKKALVEVMENNRGHIKKIFVDLKHIESMYIEYANIQNSIRVFENSWGTYARMGITKYR